MSDAADAGRKKGRTARRIVVGLAAAAALAVVGAELMARRAGLGDPPLYQADPDLEYRMVPSASYQRGAFRVDSRSMRSDEFPATKSDPREFRLLVLGDSVPNGGRRVRQEGLASELIARRLRESSGRPVVVGNASAKSWGPPNLLAFVRRHGWMDADAAVIVLNAEDLGDVPTGRPVVGLSPDYPDRPPASALLAALATMTRRPGPKAGPPPEADAAASLAAIEELVASGRAAGVGVLVVLHPTKPEATAGESPALLRLADAARAAGAVVASARPGFASALARGDDPYLDAIHVDARGQAILADAAFGTLVGWARQEVTSPARRRR